VTTADFRVGLEAAVALFLGRPGALARFDVSLEGFWRSFAAILLVLPSFAVALIAEGSFQIAEMVSRGIPETEFPWGSFAAERLVALSLEWVALPVVLALVARRLGIAARFVPFVVARNWGTAVSSALYAVPALLFVAGVLRADVTQILGLVVILVALQYQYRIARQTLAVPPGMAIAVVVLDVVLGLVVMLSVARLWPA
jgi:hypothetical protein